MGARHFLTLLDLEPTELAGILHRATELKQMHRRGESYRPLENRVLGMIFEKSSTRTRVSFEVAMAHFGGHAVFLSPRDSQLGRGEPVADTARVLSRMVDAVTIRTYEHEKLEEFARNSDVPVINALTDMYHPCQLLADLQTFAEHRGEVRGKTVAWIGDGNNMCHSYINAATQFGFRLRVACPSGYQPDPTLVAGDAVTLVDDPLAAAADADLVVTDVWASMGQESEQQQRLDIFARFQVTGAVMAAAKPGAIFMHCLPAHRGEEVTPEVIDGPQSVVWEEAENRLHAQKALLELLLVGS